MMTEKKEGLYGETPNTKAQGIRFVLTTVLVAVVVLGIAVWGIIYAVSGKKDTKTTDATSESTTEIVSEETVNSENTNKEEVPASGEHSGDDVVEVTNLKEEETVATTETATETKTETPAATTAAEKDIPKTGPEGILPVALLAGALVAFAGSAKLAKIKA